MTDRENGDFADERIVPPPPGEQEAERVYQDPPPEGPGATPFQEGPARSAPPPPPPGQGQGQGQEGSARGAAPAPQPPPWERQPPPPGYQGQPGAAQPRPGGAERGPHPGSHRMGADPPTQWVSPPRGPRADPPDWNAVRDQTAAMPSASWAEGPPQPREEGRWGDPGATGAPTTNWSYVDRIRTSELVPTRKVPPHGGWRRAVYQATFGLVNPGQSPDERRQAELETKIRTLLRGHYKIGVMGKGGVGKTTIAACVGSIFAQLRQEDRVVAVDADTAFGKLGSRVDPNAAGSYWELAADQHLHSFADVRSRVGNNSAGLFVLAGEASTAPRRRVIDPAVYREATARLDNHFTISIIDCGSTLDAPITGEVIRDLDALIVVSSPWVDGASAAGQTMEWLANRGFTGLLHRTVVVLNDSDGHADKRTRSVLTEQFGSRGQTVIEVPYDEHLRPGGVIDIDHELNRTTRRRLIEIAAAIAEHFAATTDRPRERR